MVKALTIRALDSRLKCLPAVPFSGKNLEQVDHTRVTVTKQYNLVKVKVKRR